MWTAMARVSTSRTRLDGRAPTPPKDYSRGKHEKDDPDKANEEFVVHVRTSWRELIAEVPRDPFIPDTIWVDLDTRHPQSGFVALSKQDDP